MPMNCKKNYVGRYNGNSNTFSCYTFDIKFYLNDHVNAIQHPVGERNVTDDKVFQVIMFSFSCRQCLLK